MAEKKERRAEVEAVNGGRVVQGELDIRLPKRYEESVARLSKDEQERLTAKFSSMTYEPGDAIGVVAAQSISEPATQTTLRAYHLAGRTQLVTTTGLPRLLELFDARRVPTTPAMEIFLDEDYNTKEKAHELAAQIKATSLKNLIAEDAVDILNLRVEVKLDQKQLQELGVNRDDVEALIRKGIKNVEVTAKGDVLTVEPKRATLTVKDLQTIRVKTRNLHAKGIKGLEQAIVEKKQDELGRERWVIRTLGSNLHRILRMPGIDSTKTVSNNIYEVAKELGIEAARNTIVREVINTMREQGVDTDIRHVLLVADAMTRDGSIKAIGRYGVAGEKPSVLSRANFEETIKHLTAAACAGEVDPLIGIIENIIVGNLAPIGTGLIKIRVAKKARGAAKELPEV